MSVPARCTSAFDYCPRFLPCSLAHRSLILELLVAGGVFTRKRVPFSQLIPLIACFALSSPLANLALAHKSVGFFQMMKILMTPYTAAVEVVMHGVMFNRREISSLTVICVGVAIATLNDIHVCSYVSVRMRVLLRGCLAVILTSLPRPYQRPHCTSDCRLLCQ